MDELYADHYLWVSRFMAYALRHRPDYFSNLSVDDNGWVDVNQLAASLSISMQKIVSPDDIEKVVTNDPQKRFLILKNKIRASQGHSLNVDLGLIASDPPEVLFHGTSKELLDSIMDMGLHRGSLQYVHMSASYDVAWNVACRSKLPTVLGIRAVDAQNSGVHFYKSDNDVWLAKQIPATFIDFRLTNPTPGC